jgi:hypothetical protein
MVSGVIEQLKIKGHEIELIHKNQPLYMNDGGYNR